MPDSLRPLPYSFMPRLFLVIRIEVFSTQLKKNGNWQIEIFHGISYRKSLAEVRTLYENQEL